MSWALAIWAGVFSSLWCAFGIAGLRSALVFKTLRALPAPEPSVWPRLTVVVAALDEEATIGPALETLVRQDYPDLEIVVVDDRSRDGTGRIVDEVAAREPRVRAIHVRTLPEGWLGKVHAMHRATEVASGAWILYTDADVHFAPGALRHAVAQFGAERVVFGSDYPIHERFLDWGVSAFRAANFDAAVRHGHEGVMAKALDGAYESGRRGAGWLKVKRARTLDLVVLAAEWGHGRRRGWLSNLHLGARDPATGGFVMLGKTFKGMTDQMLAWQTERLLQLEIARDDYTVYVRPELVVEIAFNDVQESPHYAGGLALRFARVKRYRDDKRAADADTIETVRAISARSAG